MTSRASRAIPMVIIEIIVFLFITEIIMRMVTNFIYTESAFKRRNSHSLRSRDVHFVCKVS